MAQGRVPSPITESVSELENLSYQMVKRNRKSLNSRNLDSARREFLREILYKNIAIIAIQNSKMYFFDTSGDFSHTVE